MVLCYFHDIREETYTFLWQSADFFQPADVFRVNLNFVEDEKAYVNLKKSILGDELDEDEEGSDDASDDEDEEESDDEDDELMEIRDKTETNLINLRRTIYLTIMSSVDFEEAGHKLLKIKLEPGQEVSTCTSPP
jgi:pre-mRNA-splicing factor CWC22